MQLEQSPVIDVVIPTHEKDLLTLDHVISGVRRNIANVRRIIVVSKEKYTNKAEWFDESRYPFSYQEISNLLEGNRVGWHYQQLLKLYAGLVIPDISKNVLIIDADTVFYRKVKFFSEAGLPLYNLCKDKDLDESDFQKSTFEHIAKILPDIAQNFPKDFVNVSGVCHHMLFQKHVIEDMMRRVEIADGNHSKFYQIFLNNRENSCGVSEYNLYFYFLISCHAKSYQIRILKYKNTAKFNPWFEILRRKYDYCSYHSYMRENRKCFFDKLKNSFLFEQWNIGVINFPITEILQKDQKVFWLSAPTKSTFHADPFGFKIGNKKFVIFEDYQRFLMGRGRIAVAEFDGKKLRNKKIILDDKKHLSYPFIINHEDKIYLVCESYKSSKLMLYEIDQNTLQPKEVCELFSEKKVIDPTIFFHQNKFWLFYTTNKNPYSDLHLAYSDSLFGKFVDHPQNPIKSDKSSARPAGTLFKIGNEIFRPAQNCSQNYGGSVAINRIVELNEKSFSEEFVKEISPPSQGEYRFGLHTISEFGDYTLVDGRRMVFAWYKPLISLFCKLRRIL